MFGLKKYKKNRRSGSERQNENRVEIFLTKTEDTDVTGGLRMRNVNIDCNVNTASSMGSPDVNVTSNVTIQCVDSSMSNVQSHSTSNVNAFTSNVDTPSSSKHTGSTSILKSMKTSKMKFKAKHSNSGTSNVEKKYRNVAKNVVKKLRHDHAKNETSSAGQKSVFDAAFKYDPSTDNIEKILQEKKESPLTKSPSVEDVTEQRELDVINPGVDPCIQDTTEADPLGSTEVTVNDDDKPSVTNTSVNSTSTTHAPSTTTTQATSGNAVKDFFSTSLRLRKTPHKKDPESQKEKKDEKSKEKEKDKISPCASPAPTKECKTPEKNEKDAKIETNQDNWFSGFKEKLNRKLEDRKRTTSVSNNRTIDNIDDVERAEEADPEKIAAEIKAGELSPDPLDEDDAWEKVDISPSSPLDDKSRQQFPDSYFYLDFDAIHKKWCEKDREYLDKHYPSFFASFKDKFATKLTVSFLALVIVSVLPFPSFFQGFSTCFVVVYLILSFWNFLNEHPPPHPINIDNPPPPTKNKLLMPRQLLETKMEGFMNMLPPDSQYNVREHHGSSTQTIFMQLTGSQLRMRFTLKKIPRRAMWNEKKLDSLSVGWSMKQVFIDLVDAEISIVPDNLPPSRIWNKKYPLCIKEGAHEFFIFTRTCRDKEFWYYGIKNEIIRLKSLRNEEKKSKELEVVFDKEKFRDDRSSSGDESSTTRPSTPDNDCSSDSRTQGSSLTKDKDKQWKGNAIPFQVYMNNLCLKTNTTIFDVENDEALQVYADNYSQQNNKPTSSLDKTDPRKYGPALLTQILPYTDVDTQWLNIALGRVFFDFFTKQKWADAVQRKFQTKLSKIKLPYFMEELTITDIDLGSSVPKIRKTSNAIYDTNTGVWIDFDILYHGNFQMTLNTKLNLMRLKKQQSPQEMQEMQSTNFDISTIDNNDEMPSDDDEDEDDISDSKPGDDLEEAQGSTQKRIIEMVDKISQWKYFQQATEHPFIKKKMEHISNTDLVLTVAVKSVAGRLALNIPPSPSDRVWYGFRSVPRIDFSAKPKMGAKEVTTAKISNLIERALFQEFQRVLVLPNMDDIQVDLMEHGLGNSYLSPSSHS